MAKLAKGRFWLSVADLKELLKISDEEFKSLTHALGLKPLLYQGRAYLSPENVRKVLLDQGYGYFEPAKVFSFQMLKGGVAKTTSCYNFAIRAHMYGARVLLIDLDQQANLSFAFGIDDLAAPVFVDVLEKKKSLTEVIKMIEPGLDLVPSNLNNSIIERVMLQGHRNLAKVVEAILAPIKTQYDLIVMDTAPALSALNTSVTLASDMVVLPVTPDKFTLFGLKKHLSDLAVVRAEFGGRFREQILFNKFDAREASSRDYLEQMLTAYPDELLKSYVRHSSEIRNQVATKKTIFDTKNYGKEDFDLVTRELLGLWL